MSVSDIVKSHFESLAVTTFEVPEWKDESGNPTIFYCEPLTVEEKNKLIHKHSDPQDLNLLIDLMVMKLLIKDEKGELVKAFTIEDKLVLKRKVTYQLADKIGAKILLDASLGVAEKK